ncbi:Trp biosynthesis-associated membrane protein [Propionibacteriaceae bacterium Y1685]|uniref:Trp biosynthesis-associated membrane protein n=1 Tax=Microlunatus sp. Y1700 TaxID=3418487 RepID=UPI003B7B04C8
MTAARGPWRLVAHLLLALVGLVVLLWPVTVGAEAAIMCREQVMQPGDTCAKADGEAEQTYEERLSTRRTAAPVIMVVGGAMIIFSAVLAVGELRALRADRSRSPVPPASQ